MKVAKQLTCRRRRISHPKNLGVLRGGIYRALILRISQIYDVDNAATWTCRRPYSAGQDEEGGECQGW